VIFSSAFATWKIFFTWSSSHVVTCDLQIFWILHAAELLLFASKFESVIIKKKQNKSPHSLILPSVLFFSFLAELSMPIPRARSVPEAGKIGFCTIMLTFILFRSHIRGKWFLWWRIVMASSNHCAIDVVYVFFFQQAIKNYFCVTHVTFVFTVYHQAYNS